MSNLDEIKYKIAVITEEYESAKTKLEYLGMLNTPTSYDEKIKSRIEYNLAEAEVWRLYCRLVEAKKEYSKLNL